jgi:hypothetical protein
VLDAAGALLVATEDVEALKVKLSAPAGCWAVGGHR